MYAFTVEQSLGYDDELGEELVVSRSGGAYIQYESAMHGLQGGTYYASDGEYLRNEAGYIIKISVKDLKGEIYSKVDQKIGTATAGLAAKSYVDNKEASILAQVANDISNVTITADNITFNTAFVNALSAVAAFDTVISQKVQAQTINANTISAAKTYNVDNTIYQSNTVIDGDGVRLYNGKDDHVYDSNDEDTSFANSVLKNDGSGHLANGNITWEEDGSVHIGPNGSDGIYIYDDNGTTKIKLQGDIVTNDLNLKDTESAGQDGLMIKGKGTRSLRQIDTYIGPSGINANLQTFTSYSNGPANNHGDFILPQNYPSLVETGDSNNGYTVHDWGAISICNSTTGNVPNPKNSYAESHNDMINSKRLSPGTTLVVKGFDGRGYKGYTGVSQANASLCFINGICIGPASEIRDSATYDATYNLSVDGNTLH